MWQVLFLSTNWMNTGARWGENKRTIAINLKSTLETLKDTPVPNTRFSDSCPLKNVVLPWLTSDQGQLVLKRVYLATQEDSEIPFFGPPAANPDHAKYQQRVNWYLVDFTTNIFNTNRGQRVTTPQQQHTNQVII